MVDNPMMMKVPLIAVHRVQAGHIFGSQLEIKNVEVLLNSRFGHRFRDDNYSALNLFIEVSKDIEDSKLLRSFYT